MHAFTQGSARKRRTTASSCENETIATPIRSSSSRSNAASNGSLPHARAASASGLPSRSAWRPDGTSAITMPSGPLHFQKLSQSDGDGSAICARMRARCAGSARRASVASVPPSCAHGGRIAPSSVEPATYGYWSAVIASPSRRASSTSAISSPARDQLSRPAILKCEIWTAQPDSRATVSISSTASTMRSLSLRMCTTSARPVSASTRPSAISSAVEP